EMLRDAVLDHLLRAVQRHRREALAVRELPQAERFARDPDALLHRVVPRRDNGGADGPVAAEPLARGRPQVSVAPAGPPPPPPAGDPGPDDDGVEAGGGHQKSPGAARQRSIGAHGSNAPGIAS